MSGIGEFEAAESDREEGCQPSEHCQADPEHQQGLDPVWCAEPSGDNAERHRQGDADSRDEHVAAKQQPVHEGDRAGHEAGDRATEDRRHEDDNVAQVEQHAVFEGDRAEHHDPGDGTESKPEDRPPPNVSHLWEKRKQQAHQVSEAH